MRGDGASEAPLNFTCRAPATRKRKLPTATKFDKKAARQATAEISSLRKQLASATAELAQTKRNFTHEVKMHVRAGVRTTRVATDAS
eukprot:3596623-Pleurochrysis_carterae.AAC.1